MFAIISDSSGCIISSAEYQVVPSREFPSFTSQNTGNAVEPEIEVDG